MGTSPDQLRADIENTRAALAEDVDRLADHASPGRIVRRRTSRAVNAAHGLRERVMGMGSQAVGAGSQAMDTVVERTGRATQSVQDEAGQLAGGARDMAMKAPRRVLGPTQGNPIAAGIVAFGAGMLAASLLPGSKAEQKAAGQLSDKAGELLEPVREAAAQSAGRLKQDAAQAVQEAAGQVRDTASQAAQTTTQKAQEQAGQVTDTARDSFS